MPIALTSPPSGVFGPRPPFPGKGAVESVPATVEITPSPPTIWRTRPLYMSATNRLPAALKARPMGESRQARDAGPPSPLVAAVAEKQVSGRVLRDAVGALDGRRRRRAAITGECVGAIARQSRDDTVGQQPHAIRALVAEHQAAVGTDIQRTGRNDVGLKGRQTFAVVGSGAGAGDGRDDSGARVDPPDAAVV